MREQLPSPMLGSCALHGGAARPLGGVRPLQLVWGIRSLTARVLLVPVASTPAEVVYVRWLEVQ